MVYWSRTCFHLLSDLIMSEPDLRSLYDWCSVPVGELLTHTKRRVPLRLCGNSEEMGALMARELVDEIRPHNAAGEPTRAVIPCGPACWYKPFTDLVNCER